MPNIVAFNLEAPLMSFAVGGAVNVPTMREPTWSAIVGLVGAAMGIERGDPKLWELSSCFAPAIVVLKSGSRMTDYHIIQTVKRAKVLSIRARTRADEIENDVENVQTWREYLQDASFRVLIKQIKPSEFSIEDIKNALAKPYYSLCAGRRSCLVTRIHPEIVDESELLTASVWDCRLKINKQHGIIRERRDGSNTLGRRIIRKEAVA